MGLFSSDTDVDYYYPKQVPGTEADWARQLMKTLGQQGINMPLQGTAGMSANEQTSQNILAKILSGGTFEDPNTSQYWQGLRGSMQEEENQGVSNLRRQAQRAGMVRSGPALRAEGEYRQNAANSRNTLLGSLYNQERDRDNPYTRLQAGMTYGGLPRMLEQEKMNSLYTQQMGNTMAPYQLQAPLWQQAIGNEMWISPTVTSKPSGFSQALNYAGGLAGIIGSGMSDWSNVLNKTPQLSAENKAMLYGGRY